MGNGLRSRGSQFAVMPAAQRSGAFGVMAQSHIAELGGLLDISPGVFNMVRCACAWAFTNNGTTTELIGIRAVIESRGIFGEHQVMDARHIGGTFPNQPIVTTPADGEKENLRETRNDAIRRRSVSWTPASGGALSVMLAPGAPGLLIGNLDVGIELLAGVNNYDVKLFLQRLKPDGGVDDFKDRRFSDVFDVLDDDIFQIIDSGDGASLTVTGIM